MSFAAGLIFCGLFQFLGSQENGNDPAIVEAMLGNKAAIPCNVPIPLADDEASLILWYRVDTPNPIYTLDIRNVPFKGAKHFPSSEVAERAYFDVSVHPPVLVYNPVRQEDSGDYKCRVDLRRSRTLILHSFLRVIVPPSDPIVMDEHGQHLYDVIGPYDEGANLTFICEVDGGDPVPNVTWWRGSTLVDDDFNVTTQGFVRNEMVLYQIQRSDLMQEFVCRAENFPLSKPKEATLQVDINLLPLSARIILPKPILIAGQEHEIVCETKGSRPRAITTWWLDGQKVGMGVPEGLLDDSNDTLSILHFTPKPNDDGKYLACKSVNPSLPVAIVEDEVHLKVQFTPLVNISYGPNIVPTKIKEGSNISIECTVWANPWIFNLTWQFNDMNISHSGDKSIHINNQSLMVHTVNKDHRGRYRCLATNVVGTGKSKYIKMYVQFAPVCRSSEPKIYGTSTMETLNVTCDFEADPRDTEVRWSFNSSIIRDLSNWTRGGPRSIFRYSPQTDEGYGILMCWARNGIGVMKEPCIIKVVAAGAPESPHDCVITNQTSKILVIECDSGYNGSLSQIFHMEVYDSIMEHLVENITNVERPSFTVTNLSPGTSYVLVIYASNIKGKSVSVALVGTTLLPAEKRTDSINTQIAQDEPTHFNPVFLILTGVSALVLASFLAVIVISRIHSHREPRLTKDITVQTSSQSGDLLKKDLEESQDASEKGPDIIPMSKDSEVFYMGKVSEDPVFDTKEEDPPTSYVRQKYTDTVL